MGQRRILRRAAGLSLVAVLSGELAPGGAPAALSLALFLELRPAAANA